ncbi:MAG: thioredoxin [Proteobacteria bacterium]|nr:thioredoxin [Pseudomonadota bacterium]MBU1232136.1 thioredoxin [Pseudomonadota bacterium]MBU1417850.1 thioredoxin [Pseudomonadota bacterium]MBU1453372.1 thioredoxin [Pseudomonadota bacterium]
MNSLIVSCPSCKTKNKIPGGKQHLFPKCGKCGRQIDMRSLATPVELTDTEFQSFIARVTLPVMVDFYSPTCGPCKSIAPLISKIAKDYLGRVVIAKLDTSCNPGTAMHYQIRGVPSLLFFKNGKIVDQIVGAPPESQLRQSLDSLSG